MTIEILMSINIIALVGALFTILYWGIKIGRLLGQFSERMQELGRSNVQLWVQKQDVTVCNARHERVRE